MPTKTIIITGTHHTPATELIKQLEKDKYKWEIIYISHIYPSETHLKYTLIPKFKIKYIDLDCGKFDRRFIGKTIKGIPLTLKALIAAYRLVKQINPDVVVSFGGYVSVPIIIASAFRRIPSIVHEQTLTNSLSTRICSFFASKIALSFHNQNQIKSLPQAKVVVTGNLLRSEIYTTTSPKFENLNLKTKDFPLIYITGGSQGSETINSAVIKVLPRLDQKFTIIHQTGKLTHENTLLVTKPLAFKRYFPVDYIALEDIGWILNHAKIIISRSGANICQEIVELNKNSILIPHPYTQQNEQVLNALWVKKKLPRQTIIILQEQLTPQVLLKSVSKMCSRKSIHRNTPARINTKLTALIHELI